MSEFLPKFTFEDVPDHWEIPEKFKEGHVEAVNARNGFLSLFVPARKEGRYIIEEQYAEYLFSHAGKPFTSLEHTEFKTTVKTGDLHATYTFYGNLDYPLIKDSSKVRGSFDVCFESESIEGLDQDDLSHINWISALVDYHSELVSCMELGRCFSDETTDRRIFAPGVGASWYHHGWLSDDHFKTLDIRHLNYFPESKYERLDLFFPTGMILSPRDSADHLDNRLFVTRYTYNGNELSLSQHSVDDKIVKILTAPKMLNMKPIVECMFDRPTKLEMCAPNFVPKWADIGKHTGIKLSYEPEHYQE